MGKKDNSKEEGYVIIQRMIVGRLLTISLSAIAYCLFNIISISGMAFAGETLDRIKDETLSYFKPLKGRVISVEGGIILSDLNEGSGIKKGMRLNILKEGMPLLHPVTKEEIGRVETPSGRAEVVEVTDSGSRLKIISGEAKKGDILRLSETKVRSLFYQDRSVPWEVGESFHQRLRESGRFDLLDTHLDSSDDREILEEARKRQAAIIIAITASMAGKEAKLKERILWTEDGSKLMETEAVIDESLIKDSQFSDLLSIGLGSKEALLFFDLPYSGRLITIGNFDGKDRNELVISNGKVLRIYTPGISLLEIYEIDVPLAKEHLWLDKIDVNSDGRDEIVLTTLGDDEVSSYIYEKGEAGFRVLFKGKVFLRVVDGRLIAQDYNSADGFTGPVYFIDYRDGRFIKGEKLKLPSVVNIYDFTYLSEPDGRKYILAYDEKGYLSLYDERGLRLWISREDSGGFMNTFKKAAPTIMVDRGEWSVKDKLFSFGNKAIFLKRVPLAEMARTLGFKRSEIRALWWTGLSMEEMKIVDNISGGVIDYAISGDRIYVISKPLFGIKAKNILKGENPIGSMLYVYSLKGF